MDNPKCSKCGRNVTLSNTSRYGLGGICSRCVRKAVLDWNRDLAEFVGPERAARIERYRQRAALRLPLFG